WSSAASKASSTAAPKSDCSCRRPIRRCRYSTRPGSMRRPPSTSRWPDDSPDGPWPTALVVREKRRAKAHPASEIKFRLWQQLVGRAEIPQTDADQAVARIRRQQHPLAQADRDLHELCFRLRRDWRRVAARQDMKVRGLELEHD